MMQDNNMKHFRIQRYFSNCWSFIDGIEYNSYEDAEKAIKEHYSEQNTRIINMEEDIDIEESPYWYGQICAEETYYKDMIIDEFHKFVNSLGISRDEGGEEVYDPIGELYDRAYNRVKEKYGRR